MNLTVVTTFSQENWNDYANRSILSWFRFFDENTIFHIHTDFEPIVDSRITYFNTSIRKEEFLKRNYLLSRRHKSKGYHGKWDRYCHKVFAQCESALVVKTDFLLFLDADVACLKTFTLETAKQMLENSFCGHVWRNGLGTETGFILYDLRKDPNKLFFKRFLNFYESDNIFNLKHWDDCYVFDECRNASKELEFKSLSGKYSSFIDPISVGPLGEYFDHWMSKSGKSRGSSKYRELRGRI